MSSQLFLTVVFFSLLPVTLSAGFLKLDLTADSECLLHLESPSFTGTVRLLSYETRSLQLYSQGPLPEMPVSLQLLHLFSGNAISEDFYNVFSLRNNGKWESRVIDSDGVILSVRASFHCEHGYFGPLCERQSRLIPQPPTTVESSTPFPSFDLQISNDTLIYVSLVFFVLLLAVANVFVFCFHRREVHTYQDATLPAELPQVFCIDNHSDYLSRTGASFGSTRYTDKSFNSYATLQSMV